MATFYRKEVFLFLDTMVEVLSAKINGLEDSFRPSIDVLDPNLIPMIDKVVKLANQFPSDIPDPETFPAELEIFNGYYNKVKVEKWETKLTIRDAAEVEWIEMQTRKDAFSTSCQNVQLVCTS